MKRSNENMTTAPTPHHAPRRRPTFALPALFAVLLAFTSATAQNATPTELVVAVTAIGNTLDPAVSQQIFRREGGIRQLTVYTQ